MTAPRKLPRTRPASTITALYRFYNTTDELLYIGISNAVPRRFDQHEDTKPWYTQVTRVTVEHHPTRLIALSKEESAIKQERPKYNIIHNRGSRAEPTGAGRWTFQHRYSGYEWKEDLHLYPELDCSSVVDEYYELDGEGQLAAYVRYLEEEYPAWLAADAVPILWTVMGHGICEFAPYQRGEEAEPIPSARHENFLTEFTWPYDANTGDDLDWFKLPVKNSRFPEFAQALDWTPSPMQPTCPLRSILASRNRVAPRRGAQ